MTWDLVVSPWYGSGMTYINRQAAIHAGEIRSRVYRHMLETRSLKYRVFLRYLRIFKYIAFAPVRGKFLESYYTLMRYLDDITDGDLPLKEGYTDAAEYLEEKIAFSINPFNPRDEVDWLMMYCFELARQFGTDFREETADILNALLFDARRYGRYILFPGQELKYHFHSLDIRGTIRATLKIFRDDPEKYKLLEPLGTACRYQFDIEDINADLSAGYINISLEEATLMGITEADFRNPSCPAIRLWIQQHASDGIVLLEKHHQLMPQGRFSLLQRAVFKVVYEQPARRVFELILAEP